MKLQPAHTRIEKVEDSDHITFTMPSRGLRSPAAVVLVLVGIGLIGLGTFIVAAKLVSVEIASSLGGFVGLVGLGLVVAGIGEANRSWTLERNAKELIYNRYGPLGRATRRWPADDVSSLWVDESEVAGTRQKYYTLVVGFRNGRNEDVLGGAYDEELSWVATLLSESRGAGRRGPAVPEQAPAPVRPRSPATAPETLTARRFPTGVELTFLPLLEVRNLKRKLLGIGALVLIGIIGGSAALQAGIGDAFPVWITRISVAAVLVTLIARVWILKRTAVVQILDGLVTITQNQGRGDHQLRADEIEFIQTFRNAGRTELQVLLRGKPKLRLFEGRPAEEPARMQVDAAVGDCQVCGEKMESRVVYCAKCRTPHHEECWSYVGQCSTYGCREIRFTRA
jgi:hypothetical protein